MRLPRAWSRCGNPASAAVGAVQSTAGRAGCRPEYLLGPGDVLRVSVYGQQDMTSEVRVSESGFVSFPLIGLVKAAGVPPPGWS